MPKRKYSYYGACVLRYYVLGLPGVLLQVASCYGARFDLESGIRVIDHSSETRGRFTDSVAKALDLIARIDPVRFKRVQA